MSAIIPNDAELRACVAELRALLKSRRLTEGLARIGHGDLVEETRLLIQSIEDLLDEGKRNGWT